MTLSARCSRPALTHPVNQRERADSPPPGQGLRSLPGLLGTEPQPKARGAAEPWRGGKSGMRTQALLLHPRSGLEGGPQEDDNGETTLQPSLRGQVGRAGSSRCHLGRLIRAQWFSHWGGPLGRAIYLEHVGLPDPAWVRAEPGKAQGEGPPRSPTALPHPQPCWKSGCSPRVYSLEPPMVKTIVPILQMRTVGSREVKPTVRTQ